MKKTLITLLTISLLSLSAFAGDTSSERIKLWPAGEMPYAKETVNFSERYDTGSGFIYSVVEPELYYYPATKPTTDASVIICPGGGYNFVSIESKGHKTARWFNKHGMSVFVLKYRLKEYGQPAPFCDIQRAIRLVRLNAGKYKIDSTKLGVMGTSAGGHVAACASTLYDLPLYSRDDDKDISARPAFSILVFPVISMGKETNQWSKDALLGKNPSPALLVHCTDDPAVPVSNPIHYYQELVAHKVDAELHIYNKGGHGFTIEGKPGITLEKWSDVLLNWLTCGGFMTSNAPTGK